MKHPAYGLLRIFLPRRSVNRGKKKGAESYKTRPFPHFRSLSAVGLAPTHPRKLWLQAFEEARRDGLEEFFLLLLDLL